MGDKEVGRYGVLHRGIPNCSEAYPLGGAAHGIATSQ
jgi:hypothetical protein